MGLADATAPAAAEAVAAQKGWVGGLAFEDYTKRGVARAQTVRRNGKSAPLCGWLPHSSRTCPLLLVSLKLVEPVEKGLLVGPPPTQ